MKILQICHKPPYPDIDGGCVAISTIANGLLNAGHEVKILSLSTQKHPFLPEKIPASFKQKTGIESVYINTKPDPVSAISAWAKGSSYNISRFYNRKFEDLISETLQKNDFDIVQLESLYTVPYLPIIREKSRGKVVLRSHNVEYKIWEQQAMQCRVQPKKTYLKSLAKALKKYETENLNQFDAIATISNEDLGFFKKLGCKLPMINVPLGIDNSKYLNISGKPTPDTVFHIGAMDWEPNQQAVNWLIREIWPKVIEHNPNAMLVLAGKNLSPEQYSEPDKNIVIKGEVKNAIDFMNTNEILVVPLKRGSGLRVKIIEAMALRKPVIGTALAFSGIPVENKVHCLVADDTNEIAKNIMELLDNKQKAAALGEEAKKMVDAHFNNEKITQNLVDFYQKVLVT